MHYRITLKTPETTLAEELQSNQKDIQIKAFGMLEDHGKKGEAIIERRHSPYYGDFEHYMTCGFRQPEEIEKEQTQA